MGIEQSQFSCVCAHQHTPQKNTMGGDLHMMECMNEEIVAVNES